MTTLGGRGKAPSVLSDKPRPSEALIEAVEQAFNADLSPPFVPVHSVDDCVGFTMRAQRGVVIREVIGFLRSLQNTDEE